ncbi:MAG: hypothetical protein E5X46_00455 [Mesorhizobium sp.]|nr:MAG: hypothetical protein E5X47_01015 [Mesorhizobium sp.]TIQ60924.1 MAG: hypothetical protein E5X46_00455 [Mesorhizobium sp.]
MSRCAFRVSRGCAGTSRPPRPTASRRCRRCWTARAVHRFTEAQNRSSSLFFSNSGRKTGSHFSWNCSKSYSAIETRIS